MAAPVTAQANQAQSAGDAVQAPLPLKRILVALDASDQANKALAESVTIAKATDGVVTGIHAYAAQLHDRRFRQMEGGLPDRYRQEAEMEYQRDVHDDLITQGLQIISDSYHDVGLAACEEAQVEYRRLSPEGKNYAKIVEAAGSGEFDLLAMGSLGLGKVQGSLIGTVCERVVRRCPIDVLVIRNRSKAIGDGPIVVALDGSDKSFGVLKTAFALSRVTGAEVHAIASYDPYYHYVAFNKIAKVLSEEAGKVFRFKEQEALHEELIDEGIAKIYQSHLDVAEKIAAEDGIDLTCKLLDGKAFKVINQYLKDVGASLLMAGKTGIHADDALDIGGNAENLLRIAPCHVWLGQAEHTPDLDVVAEETISWSEEAEQMLNRAPEFARGMARKAILRTAHDQGHTFITTDLVQQVADKMMPGRGGNDKPSVVDTPLTWSDEAKVLLDSQAATGATDAIRLRSEKKARREGSEQVLLEHVQPFVADAPSEPEAQEFVWQAAALARLSRVPEPMREPTKKRIEGVARQQGVTEVTLEIVELGLVEARKAMQEAMKAGGHPGSGGGES